MTKTSLASHDKNEVEMIDTAIDGCRRVALSRGRFERIDEQGRAQQVLFADKLVVSRMVQQLDRPPNQAASR
jgi:hypothetical protein